MYRRRGLRRPVGVWILRGAESGHGDTCSERENLHTGREFPAPHFFSALRLPCYCFFHLLRLLRIRSVVGLRRRRQILQRLKILQHVMIFQHRQILHHGLVVIWDARHNRRAGAIAKP